MSFKNIFKTKSSEVFFNSKERSFEIKDTATTQVWLLRFLSITQMLYAATAYFKTDELSYFYIGLFIIFSILLVTSFFTISTATIIPLEDIKFVTRRQGSTNATTGIKLKNGKYRNLMTYELEQAEEIVNLFKEQSVLIKEKSFLFL